jgi:tetratricopeptide (TPR) repeat protein
MRSLGSLHLADSKFAEARLLLIPALEGLRQVRGLEHPDTLIAMDSLAQLYLNQGVNLPEAESLTSHVREVLLRARGPTDLKTLDATNSLAMVLQTRGKSEQAEGLLKNVVEELQKQMTVDHPSTLLAMHNLAHVYYALGKKIDAERLFNEVLGRQRRLLGDRHPHTLLSMVWLAFLYLEQDELDKSEPLFIEAVNGCRAALDRNHEIAEGALAGLAGIYYRKGDRKRLGPVLIEARDITSARYGPDEKITANGNQSVGLFFLAQGEYGKAEPYFRDCLNYWEKHDLGDWNRFANELRYGISLLAQKKLPEAKFHLLVGYNGVRPDREHIPPLEEVDLGWLIEQVGSLRNANGDPWRNVSTLSVFYKDPNVRAIILDLQFPDDAFAPP